MIPKSFVNTEIEISGDIETTKTYKISDSKVQSHIDHLDALKQAIYKVLHTEKYEYPIYSFSYGIELENLIGKDLIYVEMELKRRIQECLLMDERIESVDNFQFESAGDRFICTFDVTSIYGELSITKEVNI